VSGLDTVQGVLLCFVGAFALSYGAVRMLWNGIGANGLTRGLVLAAPVTALAILFAAVGQASTGIALCMAASVLMITLGNGVAAVGRDDADYAANVTTPTSLRLILLPIAAACAVGFHGTITSSHLVALAVVGGLTLWSTVPELSGGGQWSGGKIGGGVLLLAAAIVLILFAAGRFQSVAGAMVVTPLVVLLAAPALLLSCMGLLSTESAEGNYASAGDTVGGFAIGCIAVALPLTAAFGFLRSALLPLANRWAATLTAGWEHGPIHFSKAAVLMPVATWRIDSLLLLAVALLLTPVSVGRLRLGKAEGCFLIALYLAYAAVASRSGLM